MPNSKKRPSLLYRNSLSIVLLLIALGSLALQMYTGWQQFNEKLAEYQVPAVSFSKYLSSGHFIESTFENWESEFLQMGLFVILTIFLRQQGSSESKDFDGEEDVDREPVPKPDAPWPVRKGGWILAVYKHSLSIALVLLFLLCFGLHYTGSWMDHNLEQTLQHKPTEPFLHYISNNRLWFESMQNWQSEFVSIFMLTFLSIYLRQIGSPQSKPVDAPYDETGE